MWINISESCRVSPDGWSTYWCHAGETLDLPEHAARLLIGQKKAVRSEPVPCWTLVVGNSEVSASNHRSLEDLICYLYHNINSLTNNRFICVLDKKRHLVPREFIENALLDYHEKQHTIDIYA